MKKIVRPSVIKGTVTAPASKSAMQRACAAALVRKGDTLLLNPGVSDDDRAAIGIIKELGAKVNEEESGLLIRSNGVQSPAGALNCGESGLSVRMFTPIASCCNTAVTINGHGSLVKRPLSFFDEVLPLLGVSVQSSNGLLPLRVEGPLEPADIEVDGSLSSQFLTGLLMAFAARGARNKTITVRNLASKPYIDLTLEVMRSFGLKTPVNNDYESFYFDHKEVKEKEGVLQFAVEGDWSGAAFLLVAGAIAGTVEVKGLDVFSVQADRAVLQALMAAGVSMSVEAERVEIRKSKLQAFHFNAKDCPDLFPPLAVLASFCNGTSVIEGVHRLQHKESDRAHTIQQELGGLGASIRLQDDLMIIEGGESLSGGETSSHGDHRIAMACAVAALGAGAAVSIDGAEAVSKSYPHFWQHMESLGMMVSQD